MWRLICEFNVNDGLYGEGGYDPHDQPKVCRLLSAGDRRQEGAAFQCQGLRAVWC